MAPAPFSAPYAADDTKLVRAMLARNIFDDDLKSRIYNRAAPYVEAIRQAPKGAGLEDFMQEYSLTTKEGLALMVLAEALLRVPDEATQNHLIEEKLGGGNWDTPDGDEGWLLMAASWGIGLSARIVHPSDTPGNVLRGLVRRLGTPVVRTGTRQAMNFMGHQFVLGQTIGAAIDRARKNEKKGYRYSYDMLGEASRTYHDAEDYFEAYQNAINEIGARAAPDENAANRPGISVKLSALDPRYFLKNREYVLERIVPQVIALAKQARERDLNLTVDAEEADRLEISLDVFTAVAEDEALAGWDGYGLAVQAYQKRAPDVIRYVQAVAERLDRHFTVRLVKGAYWDTEIKRAQERGLENFPVFTRKAATDLCYLDCARLLLDARDRLYPQFATHNALTIATIYEMGGDEGYEFQRLHGMGEPLYKAVIKDTKMPVRIYAPVGGYKDLLAYLVRRLLENAANSSFVAQIADHRISMQDILEHPQDELRAQLDAGEAPVHPLIRNPLKLYPGRRNSRGAEYGWREDLGAAQKVIERFKGPDRPVGSIIGGDDHKADGEVRPLTNPSRKGQPLGEWIEAKPDDVDRAMVAAKAAFPSWNNIGAAQRSEIIRHYADLLELHHDRFMGALVHEAGKTIDDGLAEIREAVDFCRYYAGMAIDMMATRELPGPVGESNVYRLEGRGVFAAISPWNFPLAIFTGQVIAAMSAGNTVIAKPAPQTPLIAYLAVQLMKEAGVPDGVCNLVLGAGDVGHRMVTHPDTAGVVFTGSTKTARNINKTLAEKDGPITPLIAETGGINAMIVDSTALPEQVADDVVGSAFRSAGQRCSALRMLFLQEDVADEMLEMIKGAAEAMRFGDPSDVGNDVGPIIDEDARERLLAHWERVSKEGKVIFDGKAPDGGTFMGPKIVEIPRLDWLDAEAFGPILHVARYKSKDIDKVIEAIHGTGYGLTFGVHSRLETKAAQLAEKIDVGNVYLNRNMVGAIVGVQPFGGRGLSGTGPKAGGPLYLTRFCEEKVVSENTTAAGGNAGLIALSDE